MRLLIDIEDTDRSFVTESKAVAGSVVMFHAPGRAIHAKIVGEVVPHHAVGQGSRGVVIYDITLLEDLEELSEPDQEGMPAS